MKLNRKWLNEEFVDLSGVPDREFVETMTIAGQKVETYERLDAELRNVVVGRVVSITRHTNSDHMAHRTFTRATLSPWPSTIPGCPAACTSQRASCAARSRTACSAP